jgi:hypothetical protein
MVDVGRNKVAQILAGTDIIAGKGPTPELDVMHCI